METLILLFGGTATVNGEIYAAGRGYNLSSKTNIAQMYGNSNITIMGTPTITNTIFGAGAGISGYANMAKLVGDSKINIAANLSSTVYGGGNIAQTQGNTYININNGNHTGNIYGGGNVGDVNGTSNVHIYAGQSSEVYGGGQSSDITNTNVYLQGGRVTTIYGGSNTTGTVTSSNIFTTSGTVNNVYGGNNAGGQVTQTHIQTNGGIISEAIYGGGKQADAGESTVTLSSSQNTFPNVYGGGYSADVTTTNIILQGAIVSNIFGGSNTSGTVNSSNINIISGTVNNVYGGNNAGGQTNESYIQSTGGTIGEAIYGGGKQATTITTNITLTSLASAAPQVYGGGQSADVTITNVTIQGAPITDLFGGSNTSGTIGTSHVIVQSGTIGNVYGGNNAGGSTNNPNVTINGGTIGNIYGGGNQVNVPQTNVIINNGTIANVYGGGNAAAVNNDTSLVINDGTITVNVYGGGNEGRVYGDTFVQISGATINGSVYAGGNGVTAIVSGNTNINIEKETIIGSDLSVTPESGCVFGGGNAAATGTDSLNNSNSSVNIVGGNIYGNVYGGANTSVVYGEAHVNIGYEAVGNVNLVRGKINIRGTIFGGGEANASGSEVYDYSFISVTRGIDMNIDATGYTDFDMSGSIFGSGNASSTSGNSYIDIINYGSVNSPKYNTSIQRATTVTLSNSSIVLSGAKDRTNEYSNVFFTISRVNEFKLKNSSSLYLIYGVNLLQKLSSLVDVDGAEVKSTVTIDPDTGANTKNVDNRIYMYEGKNLNVATNEQVTAYGEVYGMTFLGLFTNAMNPATSTGLYNYNFENEDLITNTGTFSSNSYILARHNTNHNTTVDGFYTNYDNEGYIKTGYIDVTPEDDLYYIWLVGEEMDVTTFEITLTASKYATLGTYEMPLTGFAIPNTKFIISGFSAGLANGISLIDLNDIPAIADTAQIADSNFGLTMRSGKNGWQTNSNTDFYTANGGNYLGSTQYYSDNSPYTPTLEFCFYHSQNISRQQNLGTVKIRFQVMTPVDDLTYEVSYIDINVTLATALYQDSFYEAAISPGEEFDLFTTTETNITNSSVFSTYYSLFINEFSESDYYEDYSTYYRTLVSRDSTNSGYVFPRNTKIIMIDWATNEYYYYVVSQQDELDSKYMYRLSDFVKMGSANECFDEQAASDLYYNRTKDLVYENYIFHIDFTEADIGANAVNNSLLMELHEQEGQTLIGVLGIQRNTTKYSVYTDRNSTIDISAVADKSTVYLGQPLKLDVSTNFIQPVVNSKMIYDTHYFSKQMGIKIVIYDSNDNQLNIDSLLGVNFTLDNVTYYPRVDGTTRIKIAERVSNVLSRITINTEDNSTLNTGTYTIRIESFGSPDGIYYGLQSSDSTEVQVDIINRIFGLKVLTEDNAKIIDKVTGNTLNGNNSLVSTVNYSSILTNPVITVSLYRRDYIEIYSKNYVKVDLADYISTVLTPSTEQDEYEVLQNPGGTNTVFMRLKDNLVTGTYKLVYKLYNGTNYIGEAYEYMIIK